MPIRVPLEVFCHQSRLHANHSTLNLQGGRREALGRLAAQSGDVEAEVLAVNMASN